MRLFSVLISIFVFASCSKDFKAQAIQSPSSDSCRVDHANKSQSVFSNLFHENKEEAVFQSNTFLFSKVAKEQFLRNAQMEKGESQAFGNTNNFVISQSLNRFKLESGTKFTITVDNSCLRERGLQEKQSYPLTQNLRAHKKAKRFSKEESHLLVLDQDISLEQMEALSQADNCVIGISPNIVSQIVSVPNDRYYSDQTHLSAIKYDSAFDDYFVNPGAISRDTIIAIIDNGIDLGHDDIKESLWTNEAERTGRPNIDDDSNGFVDDIYGYDFASSTGDPSHKYPDTSTSPGYSHGSHVAGLAAARTNNSTGIAGVMATHAKIMPLNVFGRSTGADTADIDTAIRYAADMGAKVINMSLGGRGESPSTERALQYAVSKGATIVVAAGNDTLNISRYFYTPASYGVTIDGMITIGATDSKTGKVGVICDFSNYSNTHVELGAPGCDTGVTGQGVLSLLRGNKYGTMAGTSMASPVAAGAAMVVYSYVRDRYGKILTPAQMESLLKEGSTNYSSLDPLVFNGKNLDLLSIKKKIDDLFLVPEPNPGDGC